jgi:hypothetical protein
MRQLTLLLTIIATLVMVDAGASTKDFALHQAVLDDDIQLVRKLLSKGAAIDVIGSRKYGYGSALHLAVREGHLDIAKLLLDRGAQVDVLDPDDFTPLHNAAWNGNLEMAQRLLDAGADIEASTYDGDTPLTLAQNNDQEQVAAFIQAKIQAPSATRTKVKSPVIADSRVIDISGTYIAETTAWVSGMNPDTWTGIKKLNGKLIVLKQTGNTITGSVGSKSNWIKGTREGNIINFYIIGGNEIIGSWEINADATKLEGKWFTNGGGGASGKWNLTKIESDAAPIPDISGTYIAETTGSAIVQNSWPVKIVKKLNGKLIVLKQTGNTITGSVGSQSHRIKGTREGNIINFYIIASSDIVGSWEISADATHLEGKWHTDDRFAPSGKWNLTKVDAVD